MNESQMNNTQEIDTVHCNVPNDQLSKAEWIQIESVMYSGGVSNSGFLKAPERLNTSLLEIRKLCNVTTSHINRLLIVCLL